MLIHHVMIVTQRFQVSIMYFLQGFAVGNGVTDCFLNGNSMMYFAYYHGLLGVE